MTVVINEAALGTLLHSTIGPVGRDLWQRVRSVTQDAIQNASGEVVGIDTGDLIGGIRGSVAHDDAGRLRGIVSTPARHRGFAYPTFLDQTGRPWLTRALRSGFRRNR